ncbi:MAG TPA: CHASE2 domain-containing protein, partial [Solirubrobacterales bacterium]|nr:CHASE2 domain-containing protein [Solirubrobacterales bacterium]
MGLFSGVEQDSVDKRFSIRGPQEPNQKVTTVLIDAETFDQLNEQWPFPRSLHGNAIDRLRKAGAKVIAYDVQFTEPTIPREDNRLLSAVRRAGNVALATDAVYLNGTSDVFGGVET